MKKPFENDVTIVVEFVSFLNGVSIESYLVMDEQFEGEYINRFFQVDSATYIEVYNIIENKEILRKLFALEKWKYQPI